MPFSSKIICIFFWHVLTRVCWYLYFSSNTDLGSSQILTKRQWYLCNTRTTKNQQISVCKTMLVSVFPIAWRQKWFHRKLHNICTGKESAIRRIHLCLWWCIYDQATSVLLDIQQWSTVSSLSWSVEQTTWRRVFPLFLLLCFILFQLHHLTPQAGLPHLCNWNLSSHQLDILWQS